MNNRQLYSIMHSTYLFGTSFAAHCGSRSSNWHMSAARSASGNAPANTNGDGDGGDDDALALAVLAASGSNAFKNVAGLCAQERQIERNTNQTALVRAD